MKSLTETMRSTIDTMNQITEAQSVGEIDRLQHAYYKLEDIAAVCERLGCNADTIKLLNDAIESLGLDIRELSASNDIDDSFSKSDWPRW